MPIFAATSSHLLNPANLPSFFTSHPKLSPLAPTSTVSARFSSHKYQLSSSPNPSMVVSSIVSLRSSQSPPPSPSSLRLFSSAAMADESENPEWDSHGLPAKIVVQLNKLSGFKKYKDWMRPMPVCNKEFQFHQCTAYSWILYFKWEESFWGIDFLWEFAL